MRAWVVWVAAALVAGVTLSVQAGVNTMLSRRLGHPLQGALASFIVGLVGLVAACAVDRVSWPGWSRIAHTPLALWSGGLLGAFYVAAVIVLSPRLGAATLFGLIVAGQMASAVLLDHFGAIGFAVHPVNAWRLGGVALVVAGVVLIRAC